MGSNLFQKFNYSQLQTSIRKLIIQDFLMFELKRFIFLVRKNIYKYVRKGIFVSLRSDYLVVFNIVQIVLFILPACHAGDTSSILVKTAKFLIISCKYTLFGRACYSCVKTFAVSTIKNFILMAPQFIWKNVSFVT